MTASTPHSKAVEITEVALNKSTITTVETPSAYLLNWSVEKQTCILFS